MNWEQGILLFVTVTVSLTVHEAAHALFALLGGDRTAYLGGQVTLNPVPHMQREPFGMLALPLLTLLMTNGASCFGFAHAPIDARWADRNPRKAALMSLAGPLANVLLATIAFAVLWFVGRPESDAGDAVRRIAGAFLLMNLLLAVFNLIPLPPLDGAGVVGGLYRPAQRLFEALQRIPYFTIVVFVLLFRYSGALYWPVFYAVDDLLPYPLRFG